MKFETTLQKMDVVIDAMKAGERFQECVSNDVSDVLDVDSSNKIIGFFSISKTVLAACIPEVKVVYADLPGDGSG